MELLSSHRLPRNVVIADRNADTLDQLTVSLRRAGHQVWSSQDGLDVLNRVSLISPDVLMLDIDLQRLDGFRVAYEVRRQATLAQTTLVAHSVPREYSVEQAQAYGFDYYLSKPADYGLLHECVYAPRQSSLILLAKSLMDQAQQKCADLAEVMRKNQKLRVRSQAIIQEMNKLAAYYHLERRSGPRGAKHNAP
jgi:DNA-binding response OmpR family regulator